MEKKSVKIDFDVINDLSELSEIEQKLLVKAGEALDTAYAPYSNFKVGAALVLENGEIVKGSNQENAAYPSGLCAERVAFYAAGSHFPNKSIKTIAIRAISPSQVLNVPIAPCGACRQSMVEYEIKQKSPITILLQGEEGSIFRFSSVECLLPITFTGEYL